MKRCWLAVLFVLMIPALGVVPAAADSGAATLHFIIAPEGTPSPFGPTPPNLTRATSNGDTVEVAGSGTITLHPKSAEGSGTIEHRTADGTLVGTGAWEATELIRYHSYGPGGTEFGLPPGSEGGKAIIRVRLDPGGDGQGPFFGGILTVDCLLGKPPSGAEEGVRLVVQDAGLNFNDILSGATLFIRE